MVTINPTAQKTVKSSEIVNRTQDAMLTPKMIPRMGMSDNKNPFFVMLLL
jgi:hypothetical protein